MKHFSFELRKESASLDYGSVAAYYAAKAKRQIIAGRERHTSDMKMEEEHRGCQ
jgi:hypothetical protein